MKAVCSGWFARGLGPAQARDILSILEIEPSLFEFTGERAPRAVVAMGLVALLFEGFLRRSPAAAACAAERRRRDRKLILDHAALCAFRFPDPSPGSASTREDALSRIFEPLGYQLADLGPQERPKVAGRVYTHLDHPKALPQILVSEVLVDRFPPPFRAAAGRVTSQTEDPLSGAANVLLAQLGSEGTAGQILAEAGIAGLAAVFGRCHPIPTLEDYETLLAGSREAAWIAAEGLAIRRMASRGELGEGSPAPPEDCSAEAVFHADGLVVRRAVPGTEWRVLRRGASADLPDLEGIAPLRAVAGGPSRLHR